MPPKRSAEELGPDISIDKAFELFGKSYKRVKASIDAATARDNENAQLRAELQEAKRRENALQTGFRNSEFYRRNLCKAEESVKRLEEENTTLHKQLSQMAEREKEALKKLDELKECLRQPGTEA